MMDERLLNLQLFCSNLRLRIDSGKPVQGGVQYEVSNGTDVVYVTTTAVAALPEV